MTNHQRDRAHTEKPPIHQNREIGERTTPPMGRYVTNHRRSDAHTPEWLTVQQVCERAHIGKSYLYEQWTDGTGPRYSQVGKRRLVPNEWLTDWLMMREVA